MPVVEVRHPLVKHKIGLLREVDISTKKFRELTAELARLLTYEACRDFELERCTIQGWAGPVEIDQIKGKKVTVVPILRAGLGMLDGVLDLIPSAKVSVVGIARNHETLAPEPYFERFVGQLDERWLRKAAGRAAQVVVISYGDRVADVWWEQNRAKLEKLSNLTVLRLSSDDTQALAGLASRSMVLQCTIQEGEVLITGEGDPVRLEPERVFKALHA